jgi:monolysocardiolipin acyltransferase
MLLLCFNLLFIFVYCCLENSHVKNSNLTSNFLLSFYIVCLNKTKIYNKNRLEHLVENRPKNQPLLTISNHYSCFDDPAIFGCLKLRNVCSSTRNRWSLAAHDICFTKTLHSLFFMFGKCIPVFRGSGVYQPAIDLCIQKLKIGDWVN